MKVGELIRKYRRMRGMTQAGLAEACGLTDSAIRNYELGNRTPGEEQVAGIAAALDVSPEALREVPLESARQALELLFRLDEEYGLKPAKVAGETVLRLDAANPGSQKLAIALDAWLSMVDSEKSGEITPEELSAWRLRS